MPQVLVLSTHDDIHAQAVCWALQDKGVNALCWVQSDFPNSQTASLQISNHVAISTEILDRGGRLNLNNPTCVWARRLSKVAIGGLLDSADRTVAERESARFLDTIRTTLGPDAFWVNPLSGRLASESKALQLTLASKLGLAIPDTLMSNNVIDIREFAKRHQKIAYKTFFPARWLTDHSFEATYTTLLSQDNIVGDEGFQLCPGIYQQYIPKAFEVRLTIIGKTPIAARLDSQSHAETNIDWRTFSTLQPNMKVEPIEIPSQIIDRCREMMQRLNIVFGCFDFIVTPKGQYVFLEVNPMGQFLWVEQACPELPLLATFAEFLTSENIDFCRNGRKHRGDISFPELLENRDFLACFEESNACHDEVENHAVVKTAATTS